MPTTKKRLNVSLSPTLEKALKQLAKRDNIPQATKASDLIRLAIEIEEDQLWDALASERDNKNTVFVSHKKAWA